MVEPLASEAATALSEAPNETDVSDIFTSLVLICISLAQQGYLLSARYAMLLLDAQ